jgi:hypothetical protein
MVDQGLKRWVLAEIAQREAEIAHYRIAGVNDAEINRIEPEIASLREALALYGPRAEWSYFKG